MAGDVQRFTQKKTEHEEKDCAGNRREAKEDECACVCAHVFCREEIDGEAGGGGEGHEVAGAEVKVTREVGPDDDERAREGEGKSRPECECGTPLESEPGDQADEDGSLIAEESGVAGGRTDDGSVVEGEVECEKEAAHGDDGECAEADARSAPVVEPRRDEEERRNQHAIEGGGGAGDVGPADEDGGPGDADHASDESEVGQESGMLASWGGMRDEWLLGLSRRAAKNVEH